MIKKKNTKQETFSKICLSIIFCSLIIQSAKTLDFDDDDDMADITLEQLEAYEQVYYADPTIMTKIAPNLIAAAFTAANLQQPLWKSTKVPSGRDTLYLLPHKITSVEFGGFALNPFFNMTNGLKVNVGDLFDIESSFGGRAEFIGFIEGFLQGATAQDLEALLPLFTKISLQERKFGFLLQTGFLKGPLTIQLNSSLQLGARNFWLGKKDRQSINNILQSQPTSSDEKELYKLRYGMGDTRLKIGLNTINMTSFQQDIGIETIIPTSRLSYTPKLKLGLAQTSFDVNELQKSGLTALKAIRDNLLNPHLGNNGHFGLGCYFESKIGIFHDSAQLWTRLSYDVFFRNEEDRLFMFKPTLTLANLGGVNNNDAGKETITNYIRQYIFPSSFKATVTPGGILNFVTSVTADFTKRLRWAVGYDFYTQQNEIITTIHNTNINISDLRVEDAQAPNVRQHKVYSELFYHKTVKAKDFGAGIGGDLTIASKRIGEDWTVYCKIAGSF